MRNWKCKVKEMQMECKSITVQCWCCPVLYFLLSMHLSKSIICRAEAHEKVSEKNSISSYLGRLTFFKSKFLFVWIKNYVSVYCSRESFTGPCVVQPLESRTEYAMFCLKTVSLLFNFGQGSKISSWLLLKNCILIVYFCLVELHVQFCLAPTLQLLFFQLWKK